MIPNYKVFQDIIEHWLSEIDEDITVGELKSKGIKIKDLAFQCETFMENAEYFRGEE